MEYQIKEISLYAEAILQTFTAGTVHSVYRRTINLTDGIHILSLQTDGSPLSPISLITSLSPGEMGKLSVSPGDPCPAPNLFIRRDARRYDLKLSGVIDTSSRPVLASAVRNVLFLSETNGFALLFCPKTDRDSNLSLIHTAAENIIRRCNRLCLCHEYPEAAMELTRLLGLGTGLTPSGDDFLCGVLAGLQFTGSSGHLFAKHLRAAVKSRLSDTIDISAAFLSCALENQFSLAVNRLYGLPSADEILASFSAIGHSSGIDTLCGILWSLEHI